jgi:hypothetical protein
MRLVLAIIASLFATMADAKVIRHDLGGNINARAELIYNEIERGSYDKIAGTCESACTMHLMNGCVYPQAKLMFHAPSWIDGHPMTPGEFEDSTRFMASFYPARIADWYLRQGRYGRWNVSGAHAIRLGARECH